MLENIQNCPHCGDDGFTVEMTGVVAECCGVASSGGECCNMPIAIPAPEQVACQWCHENPKSKFNKGGDSE